MMAAMMRAAQLAVAATGAAAVAACLPTKTNHEKAWQEVVAAMPWMMQMLEHCEAYKGAKSESDKTEVYHATQRIMKRARVTHVRGEVDKVLPNRPADPDEYALQISVGGKVLVTSQSGKRPIKRGTEPFDQVAALAKGQCVTFSARRLEPIAPFEAGKVCNFRYYAKFTDIRPCP